jgi:hypothetical protein
VAQRWCAERGKNMDDLTFDDILALRALPESQNTGR